MVFNATDFPQLESPEKDILVRRFWSVFTNDQSKWQIKRTRSSYLIYVCQIANSFFYRLLTMLHLKKIYIANSSWHWGSYGSIWTGPWTICYIILLTSTLTPHRVSFLLSSFIYSFGLDLINSWTCILYFFAILYFLSKIIMQVPFRNRIENEAVQSRSI
jgi:predicted neutral ceramidase superfamily lipid hydrolase